MSDNNEMQDFEERTVTLTLDNDLEVQCEVIDIFDVEDKTYMALIPVETVGDIEDDEIFIYRYIPSDNDELQLENIESDEEYEAVADAFEALLDELEADFDEFEDLDAEDEE